VKVEEDVRADLAAATATPPAATSAASAPGGGTATGGGTIAAMVGGLALLGLLGLSACIRDATTGQLTLTPAAQQKVQTALQSTPGQLFCTLPLAGGSQIIAGLIDAEASAASPTLGQVAIIATGAADKGVQDECNQAAKNVGAVAGIPVSPPANIGAAVPVAINPAASTSSGTAPTVARDLRRRRPALRHDGGDGVDDERLQVALQRGGHVPDQHAGETGDDAGRAATRVRAEEVADRGPCG